MSLASHSLAVAAAIPQVAPLANLVLSLGQSPTFTIALTNGTGPFTYQWQLNGTNLSGARFSSYTAYSASPANAGIYTCIVTGAVGSASSSALLTVYGISGQPPGGVATNGQSITLNATASNGQPFSYQWIKDAVVLTGQTNSALALDAFQITNCGCYLLVMSNNLGVTLSVPVSLTLSGIPVQGWGLNGNSQLGNGSASNTNRPTPLSGNVAAVAAGGYHSLFMKSDGVLWDMGANGSGQLGFGNYLQYKTPGTIASSVVAVAGGGSHSLFVESDGTLWATGNNNYGQLGNGSITRTNYSIIVTTNVVAVAAGYDHSLFIRNDATLWGMGDYFYGQLGLGTTGYTNRPVLIASNVVAVAAGYYHSLFIKGDATLWVMGNNDYGQLGIGNTTPQTSPVCVASNVVGAAAGRSHSLFITSDGTLWAMGYNGYGQLGIGNTTPKYSPVLVASNVAAAAAGYYFSLFKLTDGTLWAMGDNGYGQLGTGDNLQRKSPAPIPGLIVGSLGGMNSAYHSLAVAAYIPQISPLTNNTTCPGQPVTFVLTVTNGTGPFTYQWQLNGTNLVDATNSSYFIQSAGFYHAGNYTGVVNDMAGSASGSATLVVSLPPLTVSFNSSNFVGNIQFNLPTGALTGSNLVLQATTNLAAPAEWVAVQTNLPDASGTCAFTVTNIGAPGIFYRIVLP